MNRRQFISTTAAVGAAATLSNLAAPAGAQAKPAKHKFKLKYAPHFGTFKEHAGNDPIAQLNFAADVGFTAWEDNGMMRKPVDLQEKIARTMQKRGMAMGVFVCFSGRGTDFVTKTDKSYQDGLRKQLKAAVEVAKRVNATWMTGVPGGFNQRLEEDYQMANCVENLKVIAEVLEPHDLVTVLEPLNWWTNHPGMYLRKIPQAYMICKAVGSPSVKILDDLYHQQIHEGNLIPNMEKAWEEIAYIQVGDNPGRKEPTTGEINYKNIFNWLHDKGYEGVIGMEHKNSIAGKEGEQALIKAYAEVDSF